MKPMLGFYIGGMGAKEMNFHKNVFSRMGYEKEADQIQDLFFEGKRDEAIAAVPAQMVADISLVGTTEQIRAELPMWEESGVTTLVVGPRSLDEMRTVAEVVLG
jgi:alkanesulfonate monooxygenase SsuD/methylene tetrahydromethanopterin reductase-like flavin-dependent oxidoreductase (luciferase family)